MDTLIISSSILDNVVACTILNDLLGRKWDGRPLSFSDMVSVMPLQNSHPSTAVERAFRILEFLDCTQRAWNISEVSRRLSLPKSTTHILMLTLERLGYIERDPATRTFVLSIKLAALGDTVLKTTPLAIMALSPMRSLAHSLALTVHLAMQEKEQAVYVQKVEGPGFIRFDTYVGKRTNLHCTAVGKVLLAYNSPESQRHYFSKIVFTRHTSRTIDSVSPLKRELLAVSERGWAIDDQEEELGVRCLAVPVRSVKGLVAAALGVTGTVTQLPEQVIEKVVHALKQTAALVEASQGRAVQTRSAERRPAAQH
ncbi:MAG: IclR family transcriptional regulator [Acidobacteriaceae bacterium]|nr:IclR family transcriptional regulator [Acidobacteriaceae bacterium]MBV9937670.1 IclR family transcriptional regulator [Acidobacteriaceae bacterium]